MLGVITDMFTQLARLGVTRAAAFFYAVAVGVAANIVIERFSLHDAGTPAATEAKPAALQTNAGQTTMGPMGTTMDRVVLRFVVEHHNSQWSRGNELKPEEIPPNRSADAEVQRHGCFELFLMPEPNCEFVFRK